MFDKKRITAMVNIIVQTVQPLAVLLFGSYARGDMNDGSDIDLLVIEAEAFGNKRSRWKEIKAIRYAVRKFVGAKDILVYSKEETERLRDSQNHVVGVAFREGKVLYEARSSR